MISINVRIYTVVSQSLYWNQHFSALCFSLGGGVGWVVWLWSSWSWLWMEAKGSEYHKRICSFGVSALAGSKKAWNYFKKPMVFWDFQMNGSWIITKNLSLLCDVFDLRLLMYLKNINALASKYLFFSVLHIFCGLMQFWIKGFPL